MCHPCNLRRKSFYMILLFLKKAFRNKYRHIYVLHACFLKSAVQLLLDILPDCIARRLDYHTALYACIIAEFCFLYHIRIPLGEIHVHGCDGFYHFFVVCHDDSPFLFYITKKPSNPMHLCALQGTEQLGGTTLISLYDSLFYPLTPDLRCIHHTGLQGRLGPGFRKELPPFVPLSATCSGLTIPLLSLSHVSMSHHGKYVFRHCKFYDGLCGLSTWIFSRRLKKYAADTR